MFENLIGAHNTFSFVVFERNLLLSTVKCLKCECILANFYMYEYVYMLVCVQVCVVACVCVCRGACKSTQACVRGSEVRLWYCSSGIVHFRFLRQGLSLTWNSLKQTRLARDAQETVFISLPSAGIRSACCHSWLVECGF